MKTNRDIENWNPEDTTLWEREGKRTANRNLWISIPALLLAFAVWQMWGMITVQMLNLGFPFSQTELFTLTAIAGLTGATLRIPASFMIRIAGGRNTIFFTTVLMILPCLGAYFALQSTNTPLWVFVVLAGLSGIGGGNFAASMSNISNFFPKKQQGLSLGLNAGLGNFGVTTMQILIPLVMTMAVFGALSGSPMSLESSSGTLIGRIEAGTDTWIQNAGLLWVILLIPVSIAAWFGMNNLRTVTPAPGHPVTAFGKILGLYGVGFLAAAVGLWLFLPQPVGLGVLNMWIALPLIVLLTLGIMKLIPGAIQTNLNKQFVIFKDRHNWAMTVLYIATFGSFIGFSAALPLSIEVIFGQMMENGERVSNPDGPSALTYAWIAPFIGALIRPVGGWLSDRFGGALITQIMLAVMVLASLAVGWVMLQAYYSESPQDWFWSFLGLFLVIFAAAGIGNGSTFRSIGVMFDQTLKGPVLGWTSAIGAYGAFLAPRVMGEQIEAGSPEIALYAFAAFYALCLVINWWFYLRKNAYIKNP
ncbi:NNP family nitrate/nitrite transporter-like MFS transporter [Natronospira proteinivora]|uniref:NNP family nitrate/nitrite transporter-like MFS transporter n=1 Tax=Natronospira proteinivora TaxID=1807133 RepID=A0ABT1G7B0_9GAMM|nr:NNP family nitrate/nitrite transporter-like MFS transporter [Natronospira proteinivora]